MTDEERAEEWIAKYTGIDAGIQRAVQLQYHRNLKAAFLAGLKAGRQQQWHDLLKDPNDLPDGDRVVLNQAGMATRYDPNRGFLGLDGIGVIAWCERPKFEEE